MEVQQITTFEDDSELVSYEKPAISEPLSWTSMAMEDRMHDIKSILARPVKVYSVALESATVFPSIKFPDIILQKNKNVVRKLDYFTYFRASVKLRIVFNSTPFISGRYWAWFSPFEAETNRTWPYLQHVTGFPGVEFDLASNSPVEVKIPYCAPLSHYNLINTFSNMGVFRIRAISAIASGTSPAPTIYLSIFAWFEDVELTLPTSVPVRIPTTFKVEVGNEMEKTVTQGDISGGLNQLSVGVSAFSTPAARKVSWALKAMAGLASAVGYSKPDDLSSNTIVSNVPGRGFTHGAGIDAGSKLSIMPDNEVAVMPSMFSTAIDEMNVSYVCSKSCIFKTPIEWTEASATDSVLFEFPVSPGVSAKTGSIIHPTTLAFVSSMFGYWRGGLRYRLAAAKTAFHSGRLRVTFHPGVFDSTISPPDGLVYENAYNWIFDLSTSSEIEFEIPYVSNTPFRMVKVDLSSDPSFLSEDFSIGIVTITVLNELRVANESASPTVDMALWISGCSDISFALPVTKFVPSPSATLFKVEVFNDTGPGMAHSEQVSSFAPPIFPKSSMGMCDAEMLTCGEKIVSLRQLIKRSTPVSYGFSDPYPMVSPSIPDGTQFSVPGPFKTLPTILTSLDIDPGYFGETMTTTETTQDVVLPVSVVSAPGVADVIVTAPCRVMTTYPPVNSLHYVSYLYRFWRGSKSYKVVFEPNVSTTSGGNVALTRQDRSPLYYVATISRTINTNGRLERPTLGVLETSLQGARPSHIGFSDINGVLEFTVPYYSNLPINLVGEGVIKNTEGPLCRRNVVSIRHGYLKFDSVVPAFSVSATKSTVPAAFVIQFGGFVLYEAAGDDFAFGYQIGAPSIIAV